NLEAKGLIESDWRETPSGRQRRYYRLTKKGKARLAEQIRQWQAVAQAMQTLGIVSGGTAGLEAPA
ncbi:MAG: PadR family transcriptional regulator, partial [Phycisphaerae bacterium]